jgi:hypothetical protein
LSATGDAASVSTELEGWLAQKGPRTLGSLNELFGQKSFAIAFVLLLGVPALPLPTGGATHVFEIVASLLAVQLIVGRDEIWLPQRWRGLDLGGPRQQRFLRRLIGLIRRLERLSRPRLRFLFGHRLSNLVFGVLVVGGSAAAFLAPPFTGLDTLPALGVVLLSLAVLLEDIAVVLVALVVGIAGVTLEILLGAALIDAIRNLL